jgi:hypothetical protein
MSRRAAATHNAAEISDSALGGAAWLTDMIVRSAAELLAAGRARVAFDRAVREALEENPIQEWEADRWLRGVRLRLVKMEAFFFRAGTDKRGALSLFVRNAGGLNVGLRREAVTQMATYVSLITDFGHGRARTRFETGHMDVAVYDAAGDAWIYAENKASAATLRRLCVRLSADFAAGVPLVPEDAKPGAIDDSVMKANHIWRHRPRHFWGVSPTERQAFDVVYDSSGFRLSPIDRIPTVDEAPAPADAF